MQNLTCLPRPWAALLGLLRRAGALTLTLEIDPSLLEHLREHLAQQHSDTLPEELVAALATTILRYSGYPLSAARTDDGQIRIRYCLRSFSALIQ